MLRVWVERLPLFPGAILVVGAFVLVSIGFAMLAQRLANREVFREHNDLAGFIFAVIGVIYAVLLAFTSVGVWERFSTAETRTYDEAGQLLIVYRDSEDFVGGMDVRRDMRDYVESIIHQEWPALHDGREAGNIATGRVTHIARALRALNPRTDGQREVYGNMLSAFSAALIDRDSRLSEDVTGLNNVMWWIVLAGAIITIGFTYLFGFKNNKMQSAMIGTLATLIGLVIFLTMSMDYPFQGDIQVKPEAFHHLLLDFNNVDRYEP